jgi:hypothetical protein
MDYRLRKYILENRGKYTRSAIVTKLVKRGYDPAVVEQAWNEIEREVPGQYGPPVNSKRSFAYPRFWAAFLGFFLGLPLAVVLLSTIFSGTALAGTVPPFFVLGSLLAAVGVSSSLRQTNRPVSDGLTAGLIALVLLPFIAFAILFGICVYTYRA